MLIMSIVLITNLGTFTEPSLAGLSLGSKNTHSNEQPNGELVLRIEANIFGVRNFNANSTIGDLSLNNVSLNMALSDVHVEIINLANLSSHVNNYTNPAGFLNMSLPISSYYISFIDWRFNNTRVTVQIEPGRTTFVNVYLNASTFAVQSFDIVDPDSAGMIVGWENMYVQLANLDTIGSQNSSTFLITHNFPFLVALETTLPSGVTPVSVALNFDSNSSQWISLNVKSPIPISSILNVNLLVLRTNFVVVTQ